MRKKVLERRMARLRKKLEELKARGLASNDAAEVRAINEQVVDINEDIQDVADELAAIEQEGGEPTPTEPQNNPTPTEPQNNPTPTEPQSRSVVVNGGIVGAFGQQNAPQTRNVPVLDSIEYRNAFANYVRTGDTSKFESLEQRAAGDGMVITSDVGKIIPNTIMNEFIRELKVYGQLYNRVRKLNVRGGVEFPIEDLVPTVTWITETTVSDNKSAPEIKTSVSFGYYICEARIAQSLLSQIVSLDVLETEIARLLAEAFVKEFDRMIVAGTGSGQPLGITKDTRIATNHKITWTASELADWKKWRTKLFSIIPLAYRGEGVLIMTPPTWESYIMTLCDANGSPLAKEAYNAEDGTTTCRFAGREVILVENDILKDYDSASSGDTWCIYTRLNDYAINSNLQLGFKRYFSDDTNKWVNKGLCIVDGKLLDVNGTYLLQK